MNEDCVRNVGSLAVDGSMGDCDVEFGESKQEQKRKMWQANIKNAIYSSCWRGRL